jgi:hypothetical protein
MFVVVFVVATALCHQQVEPHHHNTETDERRHLNRLHNQDTHLQHQSSTKQSHANGNCPYSREKALLLVQKYFDREVNEDGSRGNGLICKAEVQQGLLAVMTWQELADAAASTVWSAITGVESRYSIDVIFRKCDVDKDGYISRQDFDNSKTTCLYDCEGLTDLYDKLERAERMRLNLPAVKCDD